jgi:hypothetical protein
MNHINLESVASTGEILVTLDCESITLPKGRHTLNAIRSYLETVALSHQRILGAMLVDGCELDISQCLDDRSFFRVDASTVPLQELPLVLLTTASHQLGRARAAVEAALTHVLINPPPQARELWWGIAGQIKEPILTLSLMPENLCQLRCGTTFHKLRRWQLEQISLVIQRVDQACDSQNCIQLSDALEQSVLPWLDQLGEHIRLWLDATQAGARSDANGSGC